jgi:hypothetical protein
MSLFGDGKRDAGLTKKALLCNAVKMKLSGNIISLCNPKSTLHYELCSLSSALFHSALKTHLFKLSP